ncbi:hypothetical protein ACP4OV_006776 [Aristida adscensionis]
MDQIMERGNCTGEAWAAAMNELSRRTAGLSQKMLRVNGLMAVNAILAGILVGIGVYGPRYRHRAFIHILFLGATTLFLPILSYVASSAAATKIDTQTTRVNGSEVQWWCSSDVHAVLILYWACLVQIVGINTCALVAADNREGRNMGLPVAIVVRAVWVPYLAVPISRGYFPSGGTDYLLCNLVAGFALVFTKMGLRYYAFQKARRSFALGRNPRLIVGYMNQEERQYSRPTVEHLPPRLIVMGEDGLEVEEGPHGFCFKWMTNQGDTRKVMNHHRLVTVDKVWCLEDMLLTSVPRLKEVCFSFALFKLLRCRFAGYTVVKAGFQEASNFFWEVLLDSDHERVLGVITNELCFLHQYYCTSYPVSYSNCWLHLLNILTSLLSIIYCIETGIVIGYLMRLNHGQIICPMHCTGDPGILFTAASYGNRKFDLVPIFILLVLVVLSEARDIASYVFSNWTKVALVCRYIVNHDTWQWSPIMQKWLEWMLRCQCKLLKHWDDTMNQCSVFVPQPKKTPIVLLMRRVLHLPDKKKNVKVPREVKVAIVKALVTNNGHLANPATFLHRNPEYGGSNILSKGIADMILMWHIATSILELRRGQQQPLAESDHIVATHLSQYCAYLVAFVPELLPDDDEWCKSLYKAVKKDSMHALAGGAVSSTAGVDCDRLVSLLTEKSEHEVLKNGAKLAKQLGELVGGEETWWWLLAEFWSEMVLYIAPSDNLNGHMEAIARGGELITLCWALLTHAGISSRPSADGAAV